MQGKRAEKFYITTTLPYVNAEPHIGFALEIIQADVVARFRRIKGDEVVFNTGTDEHGVKIYRKALEEGKNPQAYVDEYAAKFNTLKGILDLSYTHFIRTSDPHHKAAAQEFWRRCLKNGDIYKKNYQIKYCVGCELEKTESELENERCPIHRNLEIEAIEEENYFFRFSKYQKPLLDFYESRPGFVVPDFRFNEIKKFVAGGLQDFSISRLKQKMPWGVPVPDDPEHIMYVWFDALVNYISVLGWPDNKKLFTEFWPGVQIAGKDNLRQQSAMWQAMLMSAELPNSRQILIHGFVTVDGQKMSKSLGNAISPFDLVQKYGADPVRYYLLREIPSGEDGDFSYEKFEARYNGDLANGLGNLVARVAALGEKVSPIDFDLKNDIGKEINAAGDRAFVEYKRHIAEFRLNEALADIWTLVGVADRYINEKKPWGINDTNELRRVITNTGYVIGSITNLLEPFLPGTAARIKEQIVFRDARIEIKKSGNLFPRLSSHVDD